MLIVKYIGVISEGNEDFVYCAIVLGRSQKLSETETFFPIKQEAVYKHKQYMNIHT